MPGRVVAVGSDVDEWHDVVDPSTDTASISVHVYGANIGAVRREALHADGPVARVGPFVSGDANRVLPNVRDRIEDQPRTVEGNP